MIVQIVLQFSSVHMKMIKPFDVRLHVFHPTKKPKPLAEHDLTAQFQQFQYFPNNDNPQYLIDRYYASKVALFLFLLYY